MMSLVSGGKYEVMIQRLLKVNWTMLLEKGTSVVFLVVLLYRDGHLHLSTFSK